MFRLTLCSSPVGARWSICALFFVSAYGCNDSSPASSTNQGDYLRRDMLMTAPLSDGDDQRENSTARDSGVGQGWKRRCARSCRSARSCRCRGTSRCGGTSRCSRAAGHSGPTRASGASRAGRRGWTTRTSGSSRTCGKWRRQRSLILRDERCERWLRGMACALYRVLAEILLRGVYLARRPTILKRSSHRCTCATVGSYHLSLIFSPPRWQRLCL